MGLLARYVLVGMEPSLRPRRKKTREYMQEKIAAGARNFKGDAHIRWAAHKWFVKKGEEAFVMTDLAKCMVRGMDAGPTASRRYANCSPWLRREILIFADPLRAIVPVGGEPHRWLLAFAQDSWPTTTKPIVHPAMRFTSWKDGKANYIGLPTDEEFGHFAAWCDPKANPWPGEARAGEYHDTRREGGEDEDQLEDELKWTRRRRVGHIGDRGPGHMRERPQRSSRGGTSSSRR